MSVFSALFTKGDDGRGLTDPFPLPIMRGFKFTADGTKQFVLPARTLVVRYIVLPDPVLPPPLISTVSVGTALTPTSLVNAQTGGVARAIVIDPQYYSSSDQTMVFTVAGLDGGSVHVGIEIITPRPESR